MWLHGWNSETWRSGSETSHLIALRYSAFQLSIQESLRCHTCQTCEVVFDPLGGSNSTSYLHFGSWVQPLILCLPVHKLRLWPGSICEWGMWGERALSHPQRRQEKGVLHFTSFQSICFRDLNAGVQISLLREGKAISYLSWESLLHCHGASVVLHAQHQHEKKIRKWGYYSVFSLIDKLEVRCVVFFKRPN